MGNEVKTRQRSQIPQEYKWDIEDMYASREEWEQDVMKSMELGRQFRAFSGHLGESGSGLLAAMQARDDLWQTAEKVYVYARMKRDEDNRVAESQAMTDKAQSMLARISAETAFFTPELLEVSRATIDEFMEHTEGLRIYEHVFDELFREKEHVLTKAEENILAQMSEITSATNDIFSMINDADIKFGSIEDEDGQRVEVTHGTYIGLMQSHDRQVRKEAFTHMYDAYIAQKNTLAATYNYNTKTDVISARIRKYPSAMEAALSGDNVGVEVYDNLIAVVNEYLPQLHRYMELRRKMMGVDKVHMYDVYVPLIQRPKEKIPYEKALEIINEALAPMGADYLGRMNSGFASGWVDVYENQGKTSGAYSFGSYDSKPYMLLNYDGKLQDVFTVIHEMGHSMHSCYTREAQPFIYGGHSIFTAEVASTVNESLLIHHLLKNAKDVEEKKYLLNLHLEEFRTTLFRQTMFAEFEKLTHEAVEAGEVLTAEWLSQQYYELNQKYFGNQVVSDEAIAMEWARIPHFYNAFYVYKYATGYSAATALSKKILTEGETARDNYIRFLKSGDSDYPVELLKIAGVDMSRPEPIREALDTFTGLIDQLEALI